MKRFTFILLCLSAFLAISFTSCDTNNNQQVYMNTRTLTYTVGINDWKVSSDEVGNYMYCEFKEPALTGDIFRNGTMTAYMSFSNGALSPLPFSDFWVDTNGYQWEEYVTCEFEPGWVTFIFKTDDQYLEPYFDYTFVVKLMW